MKILVIGGTRCSGRACRNREHARPANGPADGPANGTATAARHGSDRRHRRRDGPGRRCGDGSPDRGARRG